MNDETLSGLIEIVNTATQLSHGMIATYTTIKEELLSIQEILQMEPPHTKDALERLKELKDFIKKYSEELDLKLP